MKRIIKSGFLVFILVNLVSHTFAGKLIGGLHLRDEDEARDFLIRLGGVANLPLQESRNTVYASSKNSPTRLGAINDNGQLQDIRIDKPNNPLPWPLSIDEQTSATSNFGKSKYAGLPAERSSSLSVATYPDDSLTRAGEDQLVDPSFKKWQNEIKSILTADTSSINNKAPKTVLVPPTIPMVKSIIPLDRITPTIQQVTRTTQPLLPPMLYSSFQSSSYEPIYGFGQQYPGSIMTSLLAQYMNYYSHQHHYHHHSDFKQSYGNSFTSYHSSFGEPDQGIKSSGLFIYGPNYPNVNYIDVIKSNVH